MEKMSPNKVLWRGWGVWWGSEGCACSVAGTLVVTPSSEGGWGVEWSRETP